MGLHEVYHQLMAWMKWSKINEMYVQHIQNLNETKSSVPNADKKI